MTQSTAFGHIGAAVVGAGFIGAVHVDALRRLGVPIRGVVGSSSQRASAAAARIGVPPYASLEAMLADPQVNVVHVASPNHLHATHVRAALNAGKHVICEKPLGVSSAETRELLQLARASGCVHVTHYNLRYYPQALEARSRILLNGDLGEVRLVHGGYLQDWLMFPNDWNWRLDPELGGSLRAVADIGSHWFDLVSFVTGLAVEEVCADLATFMATRYQPQHLRSGASVHPVERAIHSEDAATILLRLQHGVRAACVISQVSAGRKNRLTLEIDGSDHAMTWDSERPEELWIGHRERANEVLLRNPVLAEPQAAAAMRLPAGHAEGFADTFVELYRRVYSAVLAGGQGPASDEYPMFDAGHKQVLIGEAIGLSARERRWVTIAEVANQ